jgi:hypothetical protein
MAHRQVFHSFCHVSLRAKVVADQFCAECPAELSRVLTDVDLLDHTPWVLVSFVSEDREDSLNCLNSLNTPEARDRIAGVSPRFRQTYEWILDPGSPFSAWLRSPAGPKMFWIQGKPGSGKSTAMKLVLQDQRTLASLEQCSTHAWVVAGFFFHDRGSMIQKSIDGLLSEILYQILYQRFELVELILPLYRQNVQTRNRRADSRHPDGSNVVSGSSPESVESRKSLSPLWTTEALHQALLTLVKQNRFPLNFCFFIDALDEYTGCSRTLIELLNEVVEVANPRLVMVKICIASRPIYVFNDILQDCPGFRIHDHTQDDIRDYVLGRLRPELARHPRMTAKSKLAPS